jgi:hypothetical protein
MPDGRLNARFSPQLATVGYLAILLTASFARTGWGWVTASAVICFTSSLLWLYDHRRTRAIVDTPTSRIASAHQGHVEVIGKAEAVPGSTVLSPYSALPCVWYRYRLERRTDNNKWEVVNESCSDASFFIDDGTAKVLVDPEGAEVSTGDVRRGTGIEQRWTECVIIPGTRVYALGAFETLGGNRSHLDAKADTGALLASWKRDPSQFLSRFDLDGDGKLDLQEWHLARSAAWREVRASHETLRRQPDLHCLRRPRDGSPFLISGHDANVLARRHRFWARVHLTVAAATLVAVITSLFLV